MEFDASRRLFLRRTALAAVPLIAPVPAVKYFFAPACGWRRWIGIDHGFGEDRSVVMLYGGQAGGGMSQVLRELSLLRLGLPYWQTDQHAGDYMGISRSAPLPPPATERLGRSVELMLDYFKRSKDETRAATWPS